MADFMDQEAMESDDDNMSDEEVKLRENTRDNIFAQDILFFSCKILVRIWSAFFTLSVVNCVNFIFLPPIPPSHIFYQPESNE